jgi:outer membrane PBP1 activator LpoA protein
LYIKDIILEALRSAKRLTHYLLISLTLTILSACTTTQTTHQEKFAPSLFSELNNDSAFYLDKADQATEEKRTDWQLVSIQALITEHKPQLAKSIMEYLHSQLLTANQQNSLKILQAANLNQQNTLDQALAITKTVDTTPLSKNGYIYFLKLQTQLQIAKEEHENAVDSLLSLTQLIELSEEKQVYHDLLFSQLIQLPGNLLTQPQLSNKEKTAVESMSPSESIKQGWYELAHIYRRDQLRPNQLKRALEIWKTNNLTHPAFNGMPTLLTNISELSPYQPENIAVLLPLSGRYTEEGHAIQSGILNAYYGQQNDNTQGANPVKLHFFDTQQSSMEEIIAQFSAKNVDFVIGPLIKNNVESFLPLAKNIPVLALNSFPIPQLQQTKTSPSEEETGVDPDDTLITEDSANTSTLPDSGAKPIAWHYAFPISPEEEARQAARLIAAQGHTKPMLIAADSAYGTRVTEAFNLEWKNLNYGNLSTPESHFFKRNEDYTKFVANALQLDNSKTRISQMKKITRLGLKSEPRSRRDIDAIYIISKRQELIMLKAFIDVSISPYAEAIPLYASSRSHHNDKNEKELSDLIFSDVSLLLNTDTTALNEIQQKLKDSSFKTLRLYALGFDSFQIIGQLIQLENSHDYHYKGLLGDISLGYDNTVHAKLSWAEYKQGKRLEIATTITAE